MRLGLVIYGSLDTLTGGYLYDRIVTTELKRRGHEINVISLPQGPYPLRLMRGLLSGSRRLVFEKSCDLLLEDELCHPSLLRLDRRPFYPSGPPRIAMVHHLLSSERRPDGTNRLIQAVEKRYLRGVDGFVFNSESTRQAVETLAGDAPPGVVAYPAGDRLGFPLSPEYISTRCDQKGPLQLLFLGNLIPRKGLLPLIETLAGIDPNGWRLSVAGSPDFDPIYAEKARRRVAELGLSAQIEFSGSLPEEHLIDRLRRSHLLCMPFAYEGFGIAILEAMAFGLPGLCSREGAAAETVVHGANGFLFSATDSAEIGRVLTRLQEHRDRLKPLALEAYRTASSAPGWQQTAAIIEKFLLRLVSKQPPLPGRDFDQPGGRE